MSTTAPMPAPHMLGLDDWQVRVPAGAWEAELFRSFIERRVASWASSSVDVSDEHDGGVFRMTLRQADEPFNMRTALDVWMSRQMTGRIWLAQTDRVDGLHGVEVVWQTDDSGLIQAQTNTVSYPPITPWLIEATR